MNQKIMKILETVIINDDGTVDFPEEAKALIHEIAGSCRNSKIYQKNLERIKEYAKDLTAAQVYMDMCIKIGDAPSAFFMLATPRMLIPVIDDKLQQMKTRD